MLTTTPGGDGPSSNIASTPPKRGFKTNKGAGFLKKRHSIENTTIILEKVEQLNCDKLKGNNASDDSTGSLLDQDRVFQEIDQIFSYSMTRIMIVGPKNIGKRSFVNKLFGHDTEVSSPSKQFFDFASKTRVTGDQKRRYDFWLKESGDSKANYQVIFDIYYKTCQAFFLLFDFEDENSFDNLEKELSLLKHAKTNKDKCIIVLLAKKDQDKPLTKEGEDQVEFLKDKYGLKSFKEKASLENAEPLLELLDQVSKLDFSQFVWTM